MKGPGSKVRVPTAETIENKAERSHRRLEGVGILKKEKAPPFGVVPESVVAPDPQHEGIHSIQTTASIRRAGFGKVGKKRRNSQKEKKTE